MSEILNSDPVNFMLVKPDGVKFLFEIGEILKKSGVYCAHSQEISPSRLTILDHYPKSEDWLRKYGAKIVNARFLRHENDKVSDYDAEMYGSTILPSIIDYMTSGPMTACLLSFLKQDDGRDLFKVTREMLGDIEPSQAKLGTIRALGKAGTFSSFSQAWSCTEGPKAIYNIAHVSDDETHALKEASRFLPTTEVNVFFSNFLRRREIENNLCHGIRKD